MIEYNDSIHQLKRWSQEILSYDFVIIHRINKMRKDVDTVSCYIDRLIYKHLRTENIPLRPFAYNLGVLLLCSNSLYIYETDLLLKHKTISTIPIPQALYHLPIRLLLSISFIHHVSVSSSFPSIIISPEDIIWRLFDSVINSFSSQL